MRCVKGKQNSEVMTMKKLMIIGLVTIRMLFG